MYRRFQVHDVRQVWGVDGVWDFTFLGDVDPDNVAGSSLTFDAGAPLAVPGCFDATPAYAGKRGLVAYRKRITLRDTAPHRLTFDGVHHWCRVFVDGACLTEHVGGFTRFNVDIPDPDRADRVGGQPFRRRTLPPASALLRLVSLRRHHAPGDASAPWPFVDRPANRAHLQHRSSYPTR